MMTVASPDTSPNCVFAFLDGSRLSQLLFPRFQFLRHLLEHFASMDRRILHRHPWTHKPPYMDVANCILLTNA